MHGCICRGRAAWCLRWVLQGLSRPPMLPTASGRMCPPLLNPSAARHGACIRPVLPASDATHDGVDHASLACRQVRPGPCLVGLGELGRLAGLCRQRRKSAREAEFGSNGRVQGLCEQGLPGATTSARMQTHPAAPVPPSRCLDLIGVQDLGPALAKQRHWQAGWPQERCAKLPAALSGSQLDATIPGL